VLKVLEEMEEILKERAKITDEAKWLMCIPGIGFCAFFKVILASFKRRCTVL